jgi:transposase-like protein
MTHQFESSIIEELLKVLSLREPDGLRNTLQVLLNAAMKAEQEQELKADHYERSDEREAYRNGYKDKTVSTRLGKITVQVPQVRGGVRFYPSSLEKGIRSERTMKLSPKCTSKALPPAKYRPSWRSCAVPRCHRLKDQRCRKGT